MKVKDFKNHSIKRSNPTPKANYSGYRETLKKDFCGHCAYCNMNDDLFPISFEIDHFVPKSICKAVDRLDLITKYTNLVYSCRKCNNAKGNQFDGDITDSNPTNELFYDPVLNDYNDYFYRNEFGAICSNTEKGKDQIERLKLFRPLYALSWICEETNSLAEKMKVAIEKEANTQTKEKLSSVYDLLNEQFRIFYKLFVTAYNNNNQV